MKLLRRKRYIEELPLLVGIAIGCYWLWRLGSAWVLDGQYDGYDWPGYTQNAWMVGQGHVGATQGLRGLLHPYLMGHLGEWLGNYANAGVVIASASMTFFIASIGLCVRTFGGPWLGGATAIVVGGLSGVAQASRWSNSYALLGGCSALGIALACVNMRQARWSISACSGIAVGLAYATDLRGVLFLPLALCAPLIAKGPWMRRLGCVLLVWGCFQIGPNFRSWIGAPPAVSSQERILIQQPVVKRWLQQAQDPELDKACRRANPNTFWTAEFLKTDCAQELVRHNISHRLLTYFPFGLASTWYLACFVFFPGRDGWRGFFRGALFAIGAVGPVLVMSALTPFANRYIIQMLLPIACAVPIACAQISRTLVPRRLTGWAYFAIAFVLLKFGWEKDASDRYRPVAQNPYDHFNRIVKAVESRIGVDDLYMDCSNHFVNIAMLPKQTHKGMPILNADNEGIRCMQWIFSKEEAPVGSQVWFSTASDKEIRIRQGSDPNDRQSLTPIVKGSELWELVWEEAPFQLWRRY